MPNFTLVFLVAFLSHLLHRTPTTAVVESGIFACGIDACPSDGDFFPPAPIQFPFFVKHQQSPRCGYPGFELACTSRGRTVLRLPGSGDFTVSTIVYYPTQAVSLSDPDGCLPQRLLGNFSLDHTAFRALVPVKFTFLNCSVDAVSKAFELIPRLIPVPCLSGANFTVMSVRSRLFVRTLTSMVECEEVATVSVPTTWPFWSDVNGDMTLTWDVPDCGACRRRGGLCGYTTVDGSEVGCSNAPKAGLRRSVKYGITIGVGIPGLLCVIGLSSFFYGKIRARRRPRPPNTSNWVAPQIAMITMGLDRPTIESYPKTQLGESGRLPKPNDTTCSICLCEYEPKDTLRTIPDCSHYFHVGCIDEWLRMNATCPLCRKSPEDPL